MQRYTSKGCSVVDLLHIKYTFQHDDKEAMYKRSSDSSNDYIQCVGTGA